MSEIPKIDKLVQYGVVGLCMALIIGVLFFGWLNFKLSGNHISHSTDVMSELKASIDKNTEVLRGIDITLKFHDK